MLDPLIYGEVAGIVLPRTLDTPNSPTPEKRSIPPEMDAKDKSDAEEFEAILQRVREEHVNHRKARRDMRRELANGPHPASPETTDPTPTPTPSPSLSSETTTRTLEEMAAEARDKNMPHICLVGPSQMDEDIIHEWNHFCRMAANVRTTHRDEAPPNIPPTTRLLVINRAGRLMTVDEDWARYLTRFGSLYSLYIMSIFDQSRILHRIEDLPPDGRVLVYDPESIRCLTRMQGWTCDDSNYVMHMANSSFPSACVVERTHEILRVSNI
jgi:hypothetical protein